VPFLNLGLTAASGVETRREEDAGGVGEKDRASRRGFANVAHGSRPLPSWRSARHCFAAAKLGDTDEGVRDGRSWE
jgi:hypothetical protein